MKEPIILQRSWKIQEYPEDPGVQDHLQSDLDLFNPEKHNRTSYSFKNPQ